MSNPNLVALGTITRREVMRILRIWTQTLIPPAITMTLYFLIFGGLIGSRVGKMGGLDYMEFIVPGLVMMSVIQNSYGNISSSFFGAKFGRHVEELLVSPMPHWVILSGYVAGAVLRGLMVGAIVLCIAMLFTHVRVPHPLVTFTTVLLGATIFSLAGFVNAAYAKKFDDIAIVPTFILTTHYLEEAESLCRNLAIIDHGTIVESGPMKSLLAKLDVEGFLFDVEDALPAALPAIEGATLAATDTHTLDLDMPRAMDLNRVFAAFDAAGIRVRSMRTKSNRLEELFVRMTAREGAAA